MMVGDIATSIKCCAYSIYSALPNQSKNKTTVKYRGWRFITIRHSVAYLDISQPSNQVGDCFFDDEVMTPHTDNSSVHMHYN